LGTLKLKTYLSIVLLLLTLTSCSKGGEEMEIIAYGTPEFEEFVKTAPIGLDKAWELQIEYYLHHGQEPIGSPLFFVIDKKYIFTPYFNAKIPEVKIKGVAIDSKTGEVKYIDEKIKLKPISQFGWRKQDN